VGIDNEKIKFNPAARIKRKAENNESVRFLTPDEERRITKVLATRSPCFLPTFLISIHTGLRASEQWRLEWSDINFEQKVLTVRKLANTKSGRHIPLNKIALDALHTLHAMSGPDGPVFVNSKDTPMTAHREWFDPAVAEAKVPNFTWHKNRHTFASRLAMAGVPILTISKLLGHATIQMTMRYAHLSPDHHQIAVDKLVGFGTGNKRDTRTDTTRSRL
jgi:integrase